MSGRNMVEAYRVCVILLYIYAHFLVLIWHKMRCLYAMKSCNVPTGNFLTIIDENAVKAYCFIVLMCKILKYLYYNSHKLRNLYGCERQLLASSCLSVRRLCAWNSSAPTERIFMKFDIEIFFKNSVKIIQVLLKSDKRYEYLI